MKIKRLTLLASVLAMTLLFVGCKKEEVVEKMSESSSTVDMLQFKTAEDFSNYLENAETNNQKNGFVSFGKMADDAYYSIKPEEMFSNMDEVIQFVLDNRDLYQLILCSDEEYMVETRMYDHPFRNVANTDGIFQVGDTLYKIIEGGYAYTSVDKIDCLKQYDDKECHQSTGDLRIYIFGVDAENEQNRFYPYCPDELYGEKVNGNNKITLKINHIVDGPVNNHYNHGYKYFAKPYHKSIGWWGCNCTITANIYELILGVPGGIINMSTSFPQVINYVHGGNHLTLSAYSDDYSSVTTGQGIYSCFCTASTPDSGTVYINCHGE